MGKRTLLRGDRHRAVADAEEGVAVPLLRTRQPQVQQQVQARGRWVPYLAFAVLLAWIGVMVFVLLGGMDTICPSCTRLSNNLLEAVHGNGGSSGLHMRMKYVKGISEPESKAWVLASALPLQSFAVAEGDRVDPLLSRARGPHKTSLPDDQHSRQGSASIGWAPEEFADEDERLYRAKRVSLGGLAHGKRSAGSARFAANSRISEKFEDTWKNAWDDDGELSTESWGEEGDEEPQFDYVREEQEKAIAARSAALLKTFVPHLLHGSGIDPSLIDTDPLLEHPGGLTPTLLLQEGSGARQDAHTDAQTDAHTDAQPKPPQASSTSLPSSTIPSVALSSLAETKPAGSTGRSPGSTIPASEFAPKLGRQHPGTDASVVVSIDDRNRPRDPAELSQAQKDPTGIPAGRPADESADRSATQGGLRGDQMNSALAAVSQGGIPKAKPSVEVPPSSGLYSSASHATTGAGVGTPVPRSAPSTDDQPLALEPLGEAGGNDASPPGAQVVPRGGALGNTPADRIREQVLKEVLQLEQELTFGRARAVGNPEGTGVTFDSASLLAGALAARQEPHQDVANLSKADVAQSALDNLLATTHMARHQANADIAKTSHIGGAGSVRDDVVPPENRSSHQAQEDITKAGNLHGARQDSDVVQTLEQEQQRGGLPHISYTGNVEDRIDPDVIRTLESTQVVAAEAAAAVAKTGKLAGAASAKTGDAGNGDIFAAALARGSQLDRANLSDHLAAKDFLKAWSGQQSHPVLMQAEQIRASYAAMRAPPAEEKPAWWEMAPPAPAGQQSPVETATRPVHVVLMTGHFFGKEYERIVPNCTFEGRPLHCQYHKDEGVAAQIAADALWYHVPTMFVGSDMTRNKRRKEQLSVGMSMESEEYYSMVGNDEFWKGFDVEMTYRNSSQVLVPYFQMSYMKDWEEKLPLPTALKKNAIAYINSNCATPSGRDRIMDSLIRNGSIPVESYGACANNMGHSRDKSKLDIFREYKFCVCMENSLARGYVTEKVYDGLVAGCLPIYYGAPDIANFVPDMKGILDYRNFGTPEALLEEIVRLSNNDTAYEEAMAWHYRPRSTHSPGFQHLVQLADEPHTQCRLCQHVVQHRLNMSSIAPPNGEESVATLSRRHRVVLRL